MDIRKIKKLIDLVEESSINELEINEGEESIRIVKAAPQTLLAQQAASILPATPMPAPGLTDTASNPPTSSDLPEGHMITAPMVGTFYSAPSPTSANFVQIGDKVKVGDPLCIIEAMKLMNQIESDVSGTVKAILANNGDPIEFDQPLFVIA